MTPSPPRPALEPRRLSPAMAQGSGGLEIRMVPYSPPRISSATSTSASTTASVSSQRIPAAHNGDSVRSPLRPASSRSESHAVDHFSDQGDEHRLLNYGRWDQSHLPEASASSSKLAVMNARHAQDADDASITSSSRASSPRPPSSLRSKRVISINPDTKTFSLLPLSGSATSRSESLGSSLLQSTTHSGSWGRVSSNAFIIDDRAGSPLVPVSERRLSANLGAGPTSVIPGELRTRGGMRRVEATPELQADTRDAVSVSSEAAWLSPLEALPEGASDVVDPRYEDIASHRLNTKDSFQSSQTASTRSETTNYKVYGESSPAPFARRDSSDIEEPNYNIYPQSSPVISYAHEPVSPIDESTSLPSILPSSSSSSLSSSDDPNYARPNYEILAASSDIQSLAGDRPPSVDSDANYIVHGRPSASYSSLVTTRSRLQPEYSQESLVVAPLRPVKQRSFERSPILKNRSRESLRRGSLSSLSSTLSQEATRSLITGSFNAYTQGGIRRQQPWGVAVNMMTSDSHQWAAPLSPVMSESERASLPPSRSLSGFSLGDRRSSVNSRHVLSISSSLMGLDAHVNALAEPPAAVLHPDLARDIPDHLPQIRDHDEYGDGLADLDSPYQRSSRARLGSFVSNGGPDRPLRSSASSRSMNMFSFPGWARLYYGQGERRFIIAQPSTDSIRSMYNGSLYNENAPLPPVSANYRLNRSPSGEQYTNDIRNPRRRPHDGVLSLEQSGIGNTPEKVARDSVRPPSRVISIARRMKKQTSSIWSPHLHPDKRASGFSMWDPPEGPWSDDNIFDWKRNRQIVLFVIGFLIPFSWMVAAFLPLPDKPTASMVEQPSNNNNNNNNTSHGDLSIKSGDGLRSLDEIRYRSAIWWRNLNRVMSVFGLLVIGAIIALVVVGVREQWTS